jgi:hypothetical protein
MLIDLRYSIISILVVTIGALLLVFRDRLGLPDIVVGTISGFVFALAAGMLSLGYDVAKSKRREEEKRRSIFMAIYLELLEFVAFFDGVFPKDEPQPKSIAFLPPLSRVAWEQARLNGYIRADDPFCTVLIHCFETANNFVYLMNQIIDIQWKSTRPAQERDTTTSGILRMLKKNNESLIPLLYEAKDKLETELDISSDEVERLKEEIKQKALSFRTPPE